MASKDPGTKQGSVSVKSLGPLKEPEGIKKVMKVVITGASGSIGHLVSYMVAKGDVFGEDQMMDLVLVEYQSRMKILKQGTAVELLMCNLALVRKLTCVVSLDEAFRNADVIFLVSGKLPGPGLSRSDIIGMNAMEHKDIGLALERSAKPTVRIIVSAEPPNTNLAIISYHAPSLKPFNMTGVTRIDHNRAQTMIGRLLDIASNKVSKVTMWGNRSSGLFPDIRHALVEKDGKVTPAYDAVQNDFYLKNMFKGDLMNRDAEIQKKQKKHTSMTTAVAMVQHARDWLCGTKPGEWKSMVVLSDGSYGIEKGLPFSFPVEVPTPGEYQIVQGLDINYDERMIMEDCAKETKHERLFAYGILHLPEAKIALEEEEAAGEADKAKATTWSFGTGEAIPCSILGPLERERLSTL